MKALPPLSSTVVSRLFFIFIVFSDKNFVFPFQVIERLLSIPARHWEQFAYPDNIGMDGVPHTPDQKGKPGRRRHTQLEELQKHFVSC